MWCEQTCWQALSSFISVCLSDLDRAQRLEERERILREIWMNGQPDINTVAQSLNRYYWAVAEQQEVRTDVPTDGDQLGAEDCPTGGCDCSAWIQGHVSPSKRDFSPARGEAADLTHSCWGSSVWTLVLLSEPNPKSLCVWVFKVKLVISLLFVQMLQ